MLRQRKPINSPHHTNKHFNKPTPHRPFASKKTTPKATSTPPRAPTSYFDNLPRVEQSATKIEIKDSQASKLSFDSTETAGGAVQKDPLQQQQKQIKLGKHKTKQRLDNTQHISKSLSLAMKTGRLPSLIQQQDPTYMLTSDPLNAVNLQNLQASNLVDSIPTNDFDDHDDGYDDEWQQAHHALVSLGLEDLHIKETHSQSPAKARHAATDDYPQDNELPANGRGLDATTKTQQLTGFSSNSIYTSSPRRIVPKDSDIAAAATAANWFPGHMKKALEDMADRIKHVPVSIEVRDARLPLSSANPLLDSLTANKVKIIVLNKTDLLRKPEQAMDKLAQSLGLQTKVLSLDKSIHPLIMKQKPDQKRPEFEQLIHNPQTLEFSPVDDWINDILKTNPDLSSLPPSLVSVPHLISPDRKLTIILTNNNSLETTKSLLTLIKALAPKKKFASLPTTAIICGFPNVGKSTLINNLKISARMTLGRDGLEQGKWDLGTVANTVSKARAKIGPLPGVTRLVQGFKVSNNPPIVILDSPGIMVPRFESSSTGVSTSYKLALVQCISDVIADPKTQCEHLLRILNQQHPNETIYPRYYDLPLYTPITNLKLLCHFIIQKEEIETQSTQNWREATMKSSFGKILSTKEYQRLQLKARTREKEQNIGMGAVLNRYESARKTTVNLNDFSPGYKYPSFDELSYEISPELEDLALRSFLKSFRTGKLGKFMMD